MEDGIHFGLSQEDYHALERFSGSGAQAMEVSPATYWADSYFNPARKEKDETATTAQVMGAAYHMARLEPHLFTQHYVRGINLADYGEILTSHDQIKEALKELREPATLTSEKVLDAARRLRASGYKGAIKHLIEEEFFARVADWQIVLPWSDYDQILADIEAMHGNPQIAPFLQEGESEVSILWTDDKGVKWKARIDRLQVDKIVDLKTFENPGRKVLEQALYDAVQYNRLYLQAYVYWTACELIRSKKLAIKKVQTPAQKALIAAIRESPDPFEYWWVFQEKKGVPNVLARRLRMTEEPHPSHLFQAPDPKSREALRKKLQRPSMIWEKARLQMKRTRDLFLQCQEIWPDGPWGAMVPVADIDDEGFNPRWLES